MKRIDWEKIANDHELDSDELARQVFMGAIACAQVRIEKEPETLDSLCVTCAGYTMIIKRDAK